MRTHLKKRREDGKTASMIRSRIENEGRNKGSRMNGDWPENADDIWQKDKKKNCKSRRNERENEKSEKEKKKKYEGENQRRKKIGGIGEGESTTTIE